MFYFSYSKLPFSRKLVIICILINCKSFKLPFSNSLCDRALNEATSSTADYSIGQQRKAEEYDNQIASSALIKSENASEHFGILSLIF